MTPSDPDYLEQSTDVSLIDISEAGSVDADRGMIISEASLWVIR
jgi:hypothetical protein